MTYLVGAIIILLLLLLYMFLLAFRNNVNIESLIFSNFPEDIGHLSIFFISDIHRRRISAKILEKIKDKVDIVIIGGDLTEKGVQLSRVQENLMLLQKIAPVIFTWGNNDYEINQHKLMKTLKICGVIALKNEVHFMKKNNNQISFIGVDDVTTQEIPEFDKLLAAVDKNSFQILISHNPKIMEMIPEVHNVSLVLSGHTHGGQIRILGLGRYRKGSIRSEKGCKLLVSNGYGTTLVPLRLGAKPETHLITLKNQ